MSLTAIIFLVILGIILFYVEFLIIPGVTIAGIAGAICIIVGIYFGYKEYAAPVGHYILLATAIVSVLSLVFMLRSDTWKNIGLKAKIDGKVGSSIENEVNVGDTGETVTRLNLYGKVLINDHLYEAKSSNNYIDSKSKIEVKKIDGSLLIVKPLK